MKKVGVIGIKQSFEDEGVLDKDLVTISQLCKLTELELSVKIGGCEAISDIYRCVDLDVDSIVAPMIESTFGLQKFTESITNNLNEYNKSNTKYFINIESRQAFENINSILESPSSKTLNGIVVGRSDLTKSFGYGKQEVMSEHICEVVRTILEKAKRLGLKTYMGGNIGKSSVDFIKDLFEKDLLDCIETRNVILKLNKDNVNNLFETIKSMLNFESEWLEYKHKHYSKFSKNYLNRSKEIKNRLL